MELFKSVFPFFVFLFLLPTTLRAQEMASESTDTLICMHPEKPPTFQGGDKAKLKFLRKNIIYPEIAKESKIQGRVIAEAIIEKDGNLSNINVVRSVSFECDAEVKRVMVLMPKWKPAYHNGVLVRAKINISVFFILPEN